MTKTKKIIPIIIAALVGAVMLFGIVMGVITIVREATATVSYNGVTVDEGVSRYLISTFKQSYLARLNASGEIAFDDMSYWDRERDDGRTEGEVFAELAEDYVRSVVVSAYLFDRNAALDSSLREWIDKETREVLEYKAEGSEKTFNELAAPMGFTYRDFVRATELLYKAESAPGAIYGQDASNLAAPANADILESYLREYTFVKLLFIRHNDKFELDENGNRIPDGNRDKLIPLTEDEKAERLGHIADIKAAIDNTSDGSTGQMSETYFNSFYTYYNDDPANAMTGYYLSPTSNFTLSFSEMYGEVVLAALEMDEGSFDAVTVDEDGDDYADLTVFIYRDEVTPYAYTSSTYDDFFGDFYTDCAVWHFGLLTDEMIDEVNVKDGYKAIDVLSIKANYLFKIG